MLKVLEKSGRPIVFNDEVKQFITNEIQNNNTYTQNQLKDKVKEELGLDISISTISNFLSEIGSYKLPSNVPILRTKNKEKRLNYANYHLKDKFSNVIFSDESKFVLHRNTKKVFVIKGDINPVKQMPNPNYSIMVWGAISKKGKLHLHF